MECSNNSSHKGLTVQGISSDVLIPSSLGSVFAPKLEPAGGLTSECSSSSATRAVLEVVLSLSPDEEVEY